MKRIPLVLFALALIVWVSSCKKDDNPTGNNSSDATGSIIPMKTGNTWIVRIFSYDTTGAVIISGFDTLSVGRDTLIGTERWYQFGDENNFWTNKSDGLWTRRFGSSPQSPHLVFKYPSSVGDVWTFVESSQTLEVSLASNNTSLTVPGGSFSCYDYHTKQAGATFNSEEVYVKPGVGIIALDLYTKRSSGFYRSSRDELISYTLK